jgi:hypothetical protein
MLRREIVEYTADLKFPRLTKNEMAAVKSASENYRLEIDFTETTLYFVYSGRDAGNQVLEFFRAAALVLKNAVGQIKREIVWSNDEETVDFYSIVEGALRKEAPTTVGAAV